MFVILLLPAVLLGVLYGRVWATLFNLEANKTQWGAITGGILLVFLMNLIGVLTIEVAINDFFPQKLKWLALVLPKLYFPTSLLIAGISCKMTLNKWRIKHHVRLARIAKARMETPSRVFEDVRDLSIEHSGGDIG